MSRKRRATPGAPAEGSSAFDGSDRWAEKRQRFAGQRSGQREARPLRATTFVTVGVLAAIVLFVGVMTFGSSGGASAAPIQQVAATTAGTEGGRVSISAEEVAVKKLVAWDYKKGNVMTPLLAYVTPSGSLKVATRMCEPCNSTSFRVEGNQLVCNACGSRWELETSRGISGGCQGYPPEVLPSSLVDGKLVVDEAKVAGWKPRV